MSYFQFVYILLSFICALSIKMVIGGEEDSKRMTFREIIADHPYYFPYKNIPGFEERLNEAAEDMKLEWDEKCTEFLYQKCIELNKNIYSKYPPCPEYKALPIHLQLDNMCISNAEIVGVGLGALLGAVFQDSATKFHNDFMDMRRESEAKFNELRMSARERQENRQQQEHHRRVAEDPSYKRTYERKKKACEAKGGSFKNGACSL